MVRDAACDATVQSSEFWDLSYPATSQTSKQELLVPGPNSELKTQNFFNYQCPILGPAAFAPSLVSLNRTVEPQCGHLARIVSSSNCSYSFALSHMS